jgi:hypothetical protein
VEYDPSIRVELREYLPGLAIEGFERHTWLWGRGFRCHMYYEESNAQADLHDIQSLL